MRAKNCDKKYSTSLTKNYVHFLHVLLKYNDIFKKYSVV